VTGRSAGIVLQPGATVDNQTYCPTSGVVFRVGQSSARRVVGGNTLYFCCEPCALYFSSNQARVMSQRGIKSEPAR
jgi:hypothetical protein